MIKKDHSKQLKKAREEKGGEMMYKEKVVQAILKWPQDTKNETFVMELWRARGSLYNFTTQ